MKKYNIVYASKAISDLKNIYEFYNTTKSIDKIYKQIDLLRQFPYLGKLIDKEGKVRKRQRVLYVSGYAIIYFVSFENIFISRIINTKKDFKDINFD